MYLKKNLGRNIENERAFPLLLHYHYRDVIRPRCELLRNKVKYFAFEEVFPLTDEQFCLAFNISKEELQEKKGDREMKEEKDILWAYVPGL